jgi:hypothetical protein
MLHNLHLLIKSVRIGEIFYCIGAIRLAGLTWQGGSVPKKHKDTDEIK